MVVSGSGGGRRACRSSATEAVRRRDDPATTAVDGGGCVVPVASGAGRWGYGVGLAANSCMARVAVVCSAGSVSGAFVQMR